MGILGDLGDAIDTITNPDNWQYADEAWEMFVDDPTAWVRDLGESAADGVADFVELGSGYISWGIDRLIGNTDYTQMRESSQNFVNRVSGFWTGHEYAAEANVIANIDKTDYVLENLQDIYANKVEEAREAVIQAMTELNNVNGFSEYVYSLDVNYFNQAFDSIGEAILYLSQQIQTNINSIVTYSNTSTLDRVLASIGNISAKFEEGFFGVFESIEDWNISFGAYQSRFYNLHWNDKDNLYLNVYDYGEK